MNKLIYFSQIEQENCIVWRTFQCQTIQLYLDSKTRTFVEETGGANFLFVTKDRMYIYVGRPLTNLKSGIKNM